MRPGISRAFSTTQRIAQQQLFEPYIPPLNQEQKKALRKIAKADEPHYHGHMNKDAMWLLEAYNRTESQKKLLNDTLSRVQQIVHEHAGPHCYVADISMHTYSSDIHDAPFELAIVDESRPDGVSPEEDPTKLPIVYDASRFSEILMKEGFTGGFWAPPWDMGKMHHSGTLLPPTVRTLTMPWPKHRRPFLREFHYPARLVTYSPVGFSLTLPGPSILRLHKLLKSYFNLRPTLNGLLRMLFIWTRSHRMDELTTQCLALLVIRYMQESRKVPNLMDLDHALLYKDHARRTTESKMWMPYQYLLPRVAGVGEGTPRECHVVPTQLEHTVVDYTNFSSFDRKPGSQFWDFLSFWRNGLPIAKTFALSVGHNKYLKRQLPPLRNTELENEIPYILNSSEKLIQDQGFDPAATTYDPRWQPISWPLQPLVVQDPFIPTYNHADSVSRETLHSFVRHSQVSSRDLAFSWPFITAFGEFFMPPSEEKARRFNKRRVRSTDGERRYHTDTVRATHPNHPQITEPPKPVQERARTISRVQKVIQKKFGQSFTVKAFGSTEYGVSTSSSDLDLVVVDAKRMEGFVPNVELERLPDIYNVLELSRVLRKCGLFTSVKAIPTATVPIVKFKDKVNGINCDINVNEQLGLRNTGMIKRYCDIVPILRPMIAYIKRWAKPLGLNSPSMTNGPQSFSSYALVLMTISYLQSQGLAPNLQSRLLRSSDSSTGFFWILSKTGRSSRVDTRYHLGRGWTAKETTSYEDALSGWFHYWGYEHGYSTMVASIREGGLIEKQPTLVQEPQPQMSLNDHPTQQLVADGSASEERLKAQDSSPPSKLSLAGYVPDTWPENPDLNIDTSKSFDDMDDSLRKLASHSPRLPKRTPAWHTLPFCVKDPFIRKKIVTQAVGHKILELFKKNCQRVARMLSQGASLDELVICKRKGKGPQKISKRKIAPGPGSHMTSPPVVSELQELRADFIPGKDHEVLTPETRQRYPGAVALGPVEYASSVFELDNQDDELDTEALEVPDYPVQTLPEFEEEGFGLKDKYFSMARSPDEDTDQPLGGAVGSERSEELEMGHTLSQCDQGAFTPPSEAEAPSAGSGGQLLPEQDSVGASGSGPAQRLVDEACSGI